MKKATGNAILTDTAPTFVWNMRLKSLGGVKAPGVPVSGDGTSCSSSGVTVDKSLRETDFKAPCGKDEEEQGSGWSVVRRLD